MFMRYKYIDIVLNRIQSRIVLFNIVELIATPSDINKTNMAEKWVKGKWAVGSKQKVFIVSLTMSIL